jgi:hypothetical protein
MAGNGFAVKSCVPGEAFQAGPSSTETTCSGHGDPDADDHRHVWARSERSLSSRRTAELIPDQLNISATPDAGPVEPVPPIDVGGLFSPTARVLIDMRSPTLILATLAPIHRQIHQFHGAHRGDAIHPPWRRSWSHAQWLRRRGPIVVALGAGRSYGVPAPFRPRFRLGLRG